MSRVLWHTRTHTEELMGFERHWCAHLAYGPAAAAWNLDHPDILERLAPIMAAIPATSRYGDGEDYLHVYYRQAVDARKADHDAYEAGDRTTTFAPSVQAQHRFVQAFGTALRVREPDVVFAGRQLGLDNVNLNTALVAGSDPIRLAAKIHGWCESHCYIEERDRGWVAGIIDAGLAAGVYRQGAKWQDVQAFLRQPDDGPVVLSYTVCESFPDPAFHPDEPAWPAGVEKDWDKLSKAQQEEREAWDERFYELQNTDPGGVFDACMEGLRRRRPWGRLAPDTLGEVYFGPPVTVYDLFAPDRDERIAKACAPVDGA